MKKSQLIKQPWTEKLPPNLKHWMKRLRTHWAGWRFAHDRKLASAGDWWTAIHIARRHIREEVAKLRKTAN